MNFVVKSNLEVFFMNKLYLSVSTQDDVDELYADEQVETAEISSSQNTMFELNDKQALDLYHFIRQCLLLENKITIVVANEDGSLIHPE